MKAGRLLLNGSELVGRLLLATGMGQRMRGLLGRSDLPVGVGMWLSPCPSIHMLGMRFAIDVIFLDRQQRVGALRPNVKPGQLARGGRGAHSAVEVASGWLDLAALPVGTQLQVERSPGRSVA